jgi:metallo-beta-lactamase family protein
MKITFCGAARTVTGSQHLVEVNGTRILLDCGLYQGRRSETYERNWQFHFDPKRIDLVVLSHAHIDHSGNLPNLVRQGFTGDIISTFATRDLCAAMLMDSAHIQESDVDFVNKRRRKQGEPPVEPLYTQADAADALHYFLSIAYNRPRRIAPGITLTFVDAGHMLGSASVVLDIEDRDRNDGRDIRLVFSGDIGRAGIPIIRDPQPITDGCDILIMESTYGSRLHPPYQDDAAAMERIIAETYKRGGQILIPAFAVGRTQQVVYTLHQLVQRGDLPDIPVFVDSPLAIDVTAIYRLHPDCYDDEIRAFMETTDGSRRDPFGFEKLSYTRHVSQSKQLNFLKGSAIIIAASGMMEAGRILHHLKNRIEDPNTTVIVVGFQAEHTLGRRLVDGERSIRIFGETYENRARIEQLEGFSGHADRDELIAWVGAMQKKPARTFLVHGEPEAADALAGSLGAAYGLKVDVPEWKAEFEV